MCKDVADYDLTDRFKRSNVLLLINLVERRVRAFTELAVRACSAPGRLARGLRWASWLGRAQRVMVTNMPRAQVRDPLTGRAVPLFNPRRQRWSRHSAGQDFHLLKIKHLYTAHPGFHPRVPVSVLKTHRVSVSAPEQKVSFSKAR